MGTPRRVLTADERRWAALTERTFQQWCMDLARAYKWTVFHFHDSRREVAPGKWVGDKDAAGFPDLVLVHRKHGVAFRELKDMRGRLTADQETALRDLRAAGANVAVWRPCDEAAIRLFLARGPQT